MYYMTTINAYDALASVVVVANVRATAGGLGDPVGTVFEVSTTVPGVGEDDPKEWLKDALVALLERL